LIGNFHVLYIKNFRVKDKANLQKKEYLDGMFI